MVQGIPKVLFVDDEPLFLRSLQRIFRGRVEMLCAGSALEGVALAGREMPDVAVIDLHLPDLSGHELLARLHHQQPDLPCFVLTGHIDPAVAVSALQHGAAGYIEKPIFDFEGFEQRLKLAAARAGRR
jgi:DNA-binding NarL/FixJ family response regulator